MSQITFLHSVRRSPSLLSPLLGWVLTQSRPTHLRSIVGGSMFGFTHDGMYVLRLDSVKLRVGEGRSEGLSAGPPGQILKESRDIRLLLGRIPPSCFLDVLLYGHHWGLSRWRLVQSLLYVTLRPATEAPVTTLYLRGRRCTAAPNAQNGPATHVPQPMLHLVRLLRASLALHGYSATSAP